MKPQLVANLIYTGFKLKFEVFDGTLMDLAVEQLKVMLHDTNWASINHSSIPDSSLISVSMELWTNRPLDYIRNEVVYNEN